jgi:hypothetical protein
VSTGIDRDRGNGSKAAAGTRPGRRPPAVTRSAARGPLRSVWTPAHPRRPPALAPGRRPPATRPARRAQAPASNGPGAAAHQRSRQPHRPQAPVSSGPRTAAHPANHVSPTTRGPNAIDVPSLAYVAHRWHIDRFGEAGGGEGGAVAWDRRQATAPRSLTARPGRGRSAGTECRGGVPGRSAGAGLGAGAGRRRPAAGSGPPAGPRQVFCPAALLSLLSCPCRPVCPWLPAADHGRGSGGPGTPGCGRLPTVYGVCLTRVNPGFIC